MSNETILLVEDTKSIIDLVNLTLSNNGYTISVATNGVQALKIAPKLQPSLILLDILMPEMDGYQTCKLLKENELTKHIPVIFLSALTKTFDKVKAFQLGGVDYISKPIETDELLARIHTHLTIRHLQKELENSNQILEEKVKHRTSELSETNKQLQSSINELFEKSDALKESEERYRYITETITDYIYKVYFENGKPVNTLHSPACYAILGYTAQELNTDSGLWYNIIHPDDKQNFDDFISTFLKSNKNATVEHRIIHKNGETVWISNTMIAFRNDNGKLLHYEGIIKDITERKLLEQKILNSIIETEERERQHFAQELHDGIGPLLAAAKMYIQWVSQTEDKADVPNLIAKAQNLIDEAHKTSREISQNLSPHVLQNFGIITAIQNFSTRIENASQLKISITTNFNDRFNENKEVVLYRVLTECINNTLKHSKASDVIIDISKNQNILTINYNDNGIGFDIEKQMLKRTGLGLFNIKNRIEAIGGSFFIESKAGKGTSIKLLMQI